MQTSKYHPHEIVRSKLSKSFVAWLLSFGGRGKRKCHLEKLRNTLLEFGNLSTMKKAIFQLSRKCEVVVQKLTQEEIDKYRKRDIKTGEKNGVHNSEKRKLSFVCDTQNKKQKIKIEPTQPYVVNLENGNCRVGHRGNVARCNAVNNDPTAPEYVQNNQNKVIDVSLNDPKDLRVACNVPSSVLHLQKNGITISSSGTNVMDRTIVGKNNLCARTHNEVNKVQNATGLQPGENFGAPYPNNGTHITFKKERGRSNTFSGIIQNSTLENMPAKGTPSKVNEVHKTWGRSVSLDIQPSNCLDQLERVIKEINNNKVNVKPKSTDKNKNSVHNVPKKSYAVVHTGKLQARNKNISLNSATLNNGVVCKKSIEDTPDVYLPPGVTLVRHGTQPTWAEKKMPVPNGTSPCNPAVDKKSTIHNNSFDTSTSLSKENFDGRASVSIDYCNNKSNHKNLPSNSVMLHHSKFPADTYETNSVFQSSEINTGSCAPIIKTEEYISSASVPRIQENGVIQNSVSIHMPELRRTSLDMPDISDGIPDPTPKQFSQMWEKYSSETHTNNNIVPLPRRHSLDLYSNGQQHFLEHPVQLQKDNSTIKCADALQSRQKLVPNILKKIVTEVQDANSANITTCNRAPSSQTLPTHMSVEIRQNVSQDVSNSVNLSHSSKDFTPTQNVDCEDNMERSKCKETKKMLDVNSPRSKCLSRRHSASSSSSHSSLKEKILLLFGDSDEDVAVDNSCPSPEKVFRKISSKKCDLKEHAEVDIQNRISSSACEVDTSNTAISTESLITGNISLDAGSLVQLELSSSNIDKFFPSASDDEGGNSDKIQILPHLDDVSCQTSVEAINSHGNSSIVGQENVVETQPMSIMQDVILPIPTTQCGFTRNSGSSGSEEKQLQLCLGTKDSPESIPLTHAQHSSEQLNIMNDSVTTINEKAELDDSVRQSNNLSHCDGLNVNSGECSKVTDTCKLSKSNKEQSLSDDAISSQDSCITPVGETISSDGAQHCSQVLESSKPNDSAQCKSDKVQSPYQAEYRVSSQEFDARCESGISSDVSQALETSKWDDLEAPSDLDCNTHSKISCNTITLCKSAASIDLPSDIQMQQLKNTACTEVVSSEDHLCNVQLPVCTNNSLNEGTVETINSENACPLTGLENTVPSEEQSNVDKAIVFPPCENAISTVVSAETGRLPESSSSLCTKNITCDKEEVDFENLPLKKETDCDKNIDDLSDEAEYVYSHGSDTLSLEADVKVANEVLNESLPHSGNETLPFGTLSAVSMTVGDVNSVNSCSSVLDKNSYREVSGSHIQRVSARISGSSNLEVNVKSACDVTAQSLSEHMSNTSIIDSQIPLQNSQETVLGKCAAQTGQIPLHNSKQDTVLEDCAAKTAPGKMNVESISTNSSSHIGTIRVRDVNSLVEPVGARVPQSVLNSAAFTHFAALAYAILENKSRFVERARVARSLPDEFCKIEYESALRDYTTTAYDREIIFTNYVAKHFRVLTKDLCIATLSRIETAFGRKYSYKELEVCLDHLNQFRQKRERLTGEPGQRNKCSSNDLRQQGMDPANNATHSQHGTGVHQESASVLNRIHPNYGNYQVSNVELQSQLHPPGAGISAVGNSSVTEVPRSEVFNSSVLGSLLSQGSSCQNLQDTLTQHSRISNKGVAQQHRMIMPSNLMQSNNLQHRKTSVSDTIKTVHNIGEAIQTVSNHFQPPTNEVSGTQGDSSTYQNRAPPQHVQQHLQNETSSVGYRRRKELYQNTAYGSARDRTSVICQTNEPHGGNPSYASNRMGVAATAIRREATATLAHNRNANAHQTVHNRQLQIAVAVAGKTQNTQHTANESLLNQLSVPNSVYTRNEMAVSGTSTQNVVGHTNTPSNNASQSAFINQMQSTVNRYTSYTHTPEGYCAPVVQSSHSTASMPQAYQTAVIQSQVLPSYEQALQLRQVNSTSCVPYVEQFERNVGQQLQNTAAVHPVNQASQQLNNEHHLGNDFYMSAVARNSQTLSSNPHQAQNSLQHSNTANNVLQVQSNTFQQYFAMASQQHNGSNSQQAPNFRQNIAQHSYHQGQTSNQQFSHASVTVSPQVVSAAYQLYKKGPTAPNVTIVPNSNRQANLYSLPNSTPENVKQAVYSHSTGSSTRKTDSSDQLQSGTLELQRFMLLSDPSKSEERVAKRGQRSSLGQHSVSRTAVSNYVVGEHEAVQSDSSSGGSQQQLQRGGVLSPVAVPAENNYAATCSPGFVHPPEVPPPPPAEQAAPPADNNLDDVILVYEQRSNEPRTVSRDSGYTTPSPRVTVSGTTNPADVAECQEEKEVVKTEEELKCVLCGKTARELCSACRTASYCSKLCQVKDWETSHYAVCSNPSPELDKTSVS